MKRIETLIRLAKDDLADYQYRNFDRNGRGPLDVARAVDKIQEGERELRAAYEEADNG